FNTNSLWFDLTALDRVLRERGGVLDLPLIRNAKTIDSSDPSSPRVIQMESAMGAAIELFDGAVPIEVGRERFLPVKTTDDLLLLRSDAYELTDGHRLVARVDPVPLISLDREDYRTVDQFDAAFPAGPPSLRR